MNSKHLCRHNHEEDCWPDSCPKRWPLTPYKDGEKFIYKEVGCSQSSVFKHINRGKECGSAKSVQALRITVTVRGLSKHTQKFWEDSQRVDCSWRCVKNDHTDVCKTWVSAVAFLVSSHSWTWNSFRSISPGIDTDDWSADERSKVIFSESKFCHRVWRKR